MKQRSREWFEIRAGKVTASEVWKVMDFIKKGTVEGAGRRNYKAQIIAETLTSSPAMDGYTNPFMQWGADNESQARTEYELATGNSVDLEAFVVHPRIDRFGASPDGLIGPDGGLELKCPKTETHLRWLLADEVPEEHQPQMYAGMSCTDRQWWDFASFDPRLPEPLQLFVKRLPRDDSKIFALEFGVVRFLEAVDETIAQLKAKVGGFSIAKPQPKEEIPSEEGITDEDIEWAMNRL